MNACGTGVEWFFKLFGAKATIADVVKALHRKKRSDWEGWLLSRNNLPLIKALLANGADVHANNDWALRYAALYGYLDVVKFLVANGADVHAYDDWALRNAACYGCLAIVKFLVANGADVHANNDEALRNAAYNGYLNVVKFLKSEMEKKGR